jgi:aspartate aminotransferase
MTETSAHHHLSDRVRSVDRSKIRYMFDKAQAYDSDNLIHLEIGEPDFDTPKHIVNAAMEAANSGATHYTSNAGLSELRAAIAEKTRQDNGVEYDPATQITVTVGAMEALHLAVLAVANAGDRVVVPSPSWPNYETQAKLAGATPVEVPLPAESGFALDADRVCESIDDNTAAVILCSPSNPTGRIYDSRAVQAVVDAAADHDTYVIADEVYEGLVYQGSAEGIAAQSDHPNRVLTVNSVSKKYAMTGWRLGWLAGPEPIIEAVTTMHESTTACAASPSQHAALAAITGSQEPVQEMAAAFRKRRDFVVDRIAEIPELSCPTPDGAFYAFVDVSALDGTSLEIAERMLYEYDVVVAPGSGFGDAGEGYVRLSFANSINALETGFDRIESMVRSEAER